MPTAPYFLLVFALYALVTLHSALMHGYFVDGMIYASLARNLAEGYGSFWHLKFSDELFSEFREHPPLGIYLQSLAFRLFGDTELIDKFYGFVVGFGIMGAMALIWRRLTGDWRSAWFPLLAFVLLPVTGYVLSYNWLEHVLTFTIVAAALAYLEAMECGRMAGVAGWSVLAGALVFAGLLIKGPVATYPFAIPTIAALFLGRSSFRRSLAVQIISLLALAVLVLVLIVPSQEALAFIDHYWRQQVIGSILGENSVHARTKLLESLLTEELIVPVVIFSLLMLATRTSFRELQSGALFRFLLVVALAGSLPLMISHKQNDYYLFISMPFYALALGVLFQPLQQALSSIGTRYPYRIFAVAFFFAVMTPAAMLSKQGEYRKDKAFHQSFTEAAIHLPRRAMVSACPEDALMGDWNLAANFQRYYAATLTKASGHDYLLTTRDGIGRCVDNALYEPVSLPSTPLMLFRKRQPAL